jgi:hypothetical protein
MGVGGQRHPLASLPRKKPGTHCIRVWWAPGPVWAGVANLAPHWHSIPGPSSPKRVAIPTELSRPTVGTCCRNNCYKQYSCNGSSLFFQFVSTLLQTRPCSSRIFCKLLVTASCKEECVKVKVKVFLCTSVTTGVLISPYPDLLPALFCLMVRIFLLMLVLLYK